MAQPLEKLFCWSLSVREGDAAELREQATLPPELQASTLRSWLEAASEGDASLYYLETCHRVEIYGYGLEPDEIHRKWLESRGLRAGSHNLRQGLEAIRHLIRVASSLDSEVLGETQITGQVKSAAEEARKAQLLRGTLDRCLQQALRAAKKIRSAVPDLSGGTVSVAHAAVDGLNDVFDSFEGKRALVIGAGTMAVQALERLLSLGAGPITWINRTSEKIQAHALASRTEPADFSRLSEKIWSQSIIVAATSSPHLILNLSQVRSTEGHASQDSGPRVILDLGLPRNVDGAIHGYRGFYVRNVDEFRDRAEQNSERRRRAVARAEELLEEELQSFVKVWNAWEKGPLMAELFRAVESLRSEEVAQLSLEKRDEIEYILRSVYAKMLHRLIEELESTDEPLSSQVLETLVRAWRQPDQWPQKSQQYSQRPPQGPSQKAAKQQKLK